MSVHHNEGEVVTKKPKKKTAHALHAILTIATGGAWGIVWLVLVLYRNRV